MTCAIAIAGGEDIMSSIDLKCSAETKINIRDKVKTTKREEKSELLTNFLISFSLLIVLSVLIYAALAS